MQESFLAPSEIRMRLFKALGSYARGLGLFALGKKELKDGETLSAAVNLYYCIFHLGVAALVMSRHYQFDSQREFVMPDCSNLRTNKAKRLTQLNHTKLLKELRRIGESNDFAHRIFLALENSKELRECFSYGPYIWIQKEKIVKNSRVFMPYRPIFHQDEFTITPENRKKFIPLKGRVNNMIAESENLMKEFSNFMKPIIEWLAGYEEIEARIVFYLFPINLLIYLKPFVSPSVFLEAQEMAEKFCDNIGGKYLEAFLKGRDSANRLRLAEKVERGDLLIMHIEMNKDSLLQMCANCWAVIPRGVDVCPSCGKHPFLELQ